MPRVKTSSYSPGWSGGWAKAVGFPLKLVVATVVVTVGVRLGMKTVVDELTPRILESLVRRFRITGDLPRKYSWIYSAPFGAGRPAN